MVKVVHVHGSCNYPSTKKSNLIGWRVGSVNRYGYSSHTSSITSVLAEYVDPADLPSFAGALYCTDEDGCGLFPVTVSTNFTGVYGTGNAVAAAVADGSTAPSDPNRRRRRLTTTVPLQDEENGDGIGANHDSVEIQRVARVRKDNEFDALTSEQDMVDMFLRRRYGAP